MVRKKIPKTLRLLVMQRGEYRCEYCKSPMAFSTQRFQIEHIYPLAKGGESQADNLALACNGCNNHKHAKTSAFDPISKEEVPLFHPRTQIWHEHFGWGEDLTTVIGLTPVGRATVLLLQINRAELLRMRQILKTVHLHPPE